MTMIINKLKEDDDENVSLKIALFDCEQEMKRAEKKTNEYIDYLVRRMEKISKIKEKTDSEPAKQMLQERINAIMDLKNTTNNEWRKKISHFLDSKNISDNENNRSVFKELGIDPNR